MSEIRWEPLEDGEYGNLYVNHSRNGESMEIGVLCDKDDTDFISRYTWSGWLPPNIRLCRSVEPQALEMPDGPGWMSDELLPCPFCGETNDLPIRYAEYSYRYVICGNCYAKGAPVYMNKDAIAKWNRRAQPATPAMPSEVYKTISSILADYGSKVEENSMWALLHPEAAIAAHKRIDAALAWLEAQKEATGGV